MDWTNLNLELLSPSDWEAFPFRLIPDRVWFVEHGRRMQRYDTVRRNRFTSRPRQCENCGEWVRANHWIRHRTFCKANKAFGSLVPALPERSDAS